MNSKEYVIWLKGFVEACHEYAPTPKQWDALKDKLAEVNDLVGTPIGPGIGVPNIQQFPTWQHPHYIDPYNPYKITCSSGSFGTGTTQAVITTTPGGGSITYATPQFVTSTATGYPSGSSWSYTNNKPHNED
jgi:hypothetical protein